MATGAGNEADRYSALCEVAGGESGGLWSSIEHSIGFDDIVSVRIGYSCALDSTKAATVLGDHEGPQLFPVPRAVVSEGPHLVDVVSVRETRHAHVVPAESLRAFFRHHGKTVVEGKTRFLPVSLTSDECRSSPTIHVWSTRPGESPVVTRKLNGRLLLPVSELDIDFPDDEPLPLADIRITVPSYATVDMVAVECELLWAPVGARIADYLKVLEKKVLEDEIREELLNTVPIDETLVSVRKQIDDLLEMITDSAEVFQVVGKRNWKPEHWVLDLPTQCDAIDDFAARWNAADRGNEPLELEKSLQRLQQLQAFFALDLKPARFRFIT
ncbi:MAG TPA: hypothetical protein VF711_08445, partial [Acidimicrobiales bacterium]